MVEYILILSFIVSFFVTLLFTSFWIKRAKETGLISKDMNKYGKTEVAELGGLPVLFGFTFGVLTLIGIETFYFKSVQGSLQVMAVLTTILIIGIIGIIDDLLGWKLGLKQWQKPLLTLFAALPIVVINAGESLISLPFIGQIDIGLIYALIIIPIGIAGAANGFNLLAGYNGLESSLGIIILATLGFYAWNLGVTWVAVITLTMVFALIAFLFFNKFPAKIFPGDTLT